MSTKYMILIYLILCHVHKSSQSPMLAVSIGLAVIDLAIIGYDLYETFIKEENHKVEIDQLLTNIDKLLDESTDKIITQNWLGSKLENIDHAVKALHSTWIDLESLLLPIGRDNKKQYEERFKSNFLNHGITEEIRFLQILLTYTVPGTSGNILDLYTEYNRCNMSALYEFEQFYYNLISTGISLEVIYNHLKYNITFNSTVAEWTKPVQDMDVTFHLYEKKCMRKYNDLLKDDISDISDAVELNKTLNERYPWMMHDIYDFKQFGTFQFLYYYSKDEHIMMANRSDGGTRLVISINRTALYSYRLNMNIDKEMLRSSIETKYDTAAAKHVGDKVSTVVADKELYFAAGITYFNNDDEFAADRIIFDKESPVKTVFVEDVSLTYCHKTGFECAFDGIDILNVIDAVKTVTGSMRVYFYTRSEILKDNTPVTGSASVFMRTCTMFGMVLFMSVVAYMIPMKKML